MDFFSVGIDIGGTNINWGIVSPEGKIIRQYHWKTKDFIKLEELSKKLYNELQQTNFLDKIKGIGIGAPAANSSKGIIENSSNLPWKGIVPIIELFKKDFSIPIHIENDARAAAWGEKIYGDAKSLENYAFITLGTGVGCGIILNNQLLIGENQFAGEVGHIIIEKNGRTCGCGRRGCLETYVSASGIVNTYFEIAGKKEENLSSQLIYEKCIQGDKFAIETFDKTAEYLSFGITNLMTLIGIKHIFLFGGPTEAGDFLLNPLKKHVHENLLHLIRSDFQIQKSKATMQNVAILGAAALVITT